MQHIPWHECTNPFFCVNQSLLHCHRLLIFRHWWLRQDVVNWLQFGSWSMMEWALWRITMRYVYTNSVLVWNVSPHTCILFWELKFLFYRICSKYLRTKLSRMEDFIKITPGKQRYRSALWIYHIFDSVTLLRTCQASFQPFSLSLPQKKNPLPTWTHCTAWL